MATMSEAKAPELRIRQGLLLVAGAVALELLVGRGSLRFYWTPLIVGLSYLAAAGVGGRAGGYWPTACVLSGWGLAVVLIGSVQPRDIDLAGAYLFGAGVGAAAGSLLSRARFDVSPLGLAVTVAAGGLILALSPSAGVLDDARTYALAIAAVGVVNVAAGVLGGRQRQAAVTPRSARPRRRENGSPGVAQNDHPARGEA